VSYFLAGKADRIFGYVPDVCPCSSMEVKRVHPPHFPLKERGERGFVKEEMNG
jgi:hypothetical protein